MVNVTGSGTCVDAGVGGRDPELRLDEFGDEGDESGDDGTFGRVGETHKQEGHVAQDPHGRPGEFCKRHTKRESGILLSLIS